VRRAAKSALDLVAAQQGDRERESFGYAQAGQKIETSDGLGRSDARFMPHLYPAGQPGSTWDKKFLDFLEFSRTLGLEGLNLTPLSATESLPRDQVVFRTSVPRHETSWRLPGSPARWMWPR